MFTAIAVSDLSYKVLKIYILNLYKAFWKLIKLVIYDV